MGFLLRSSGVGMLPLGSLSLIGHWLSPPAGTPAGRSGWASVFCAPSARAFAAAHVATTTIAIRLGARSRALLDLRERLASTACPRVKSVPNPSANHPPHTQKGVRWLSLKRS